MNNVHTTYNCFNTTCTTYKMKMMMMNKIQMMLALTALAAVVRGSSDTQYCNTAVVTKNDPKSDITFKLTTSDAVFKFGQAYSYAELFGGSGYIPDTELVFVHKNKTIVEQYTVTNFYRLMDYNSEKVYKGEDITIKFSDCISFENFVVNIRNSIYASLPNESSKFMYSYSVFQNVNDDLTRDATLCGDNFTCIKNYCSKGAKTWTYSPATQLCEYPKNEDTSVAFWETANLFFNIQ